jgi:hypothetical protein
MKPYRQALSDALELSELANKLSDTNSASILLLAAEVAKLRAELARTDRRL